MKQFYVFLVVIGLLVQASDARIRYIDKNGGNDQFGHSKYTTVQAAIDAAVDGDTVRILPGIYTEAVNIGKNILVQGGGIQNTTIAYNNNDQPAVNMTNGKLMWVQVTSYQTDGCTMSNATVSNCLFSMCGGNGVSIAGANVTNVNWYNCLAIGNVGNGFYSGYNVNGDNSIIVATAINCIASKNNMGVYAENGTIACRNCDSYSNKNGNYSAYYGVVSQTNCLETDPGLSTDGDFRIGPSSVCKDAGDPTILDLDGTRSDIGYYGGPDAPILPYLTLPAIFKLNSDTTIQFNITGKVAY